MEKNADYYKNLLNLEEVKCNGFLKLVHDEAPNFNFAYYLLEGELICPWHTMGSTESCHYIDGSDMLILTMVKKEEKWEPLLTRLNEKNRDFFIKPNTWCTFFLENGKGWSLITHFHFPSYREELTNYATASKFSDLFPEYAILGEKYGFKNHFNKNLKMSSECS